jgi:hypothetical protein
VTKGGKFSFEHHITTDDVIGLTATVDAENDTVSFKLKGRNPGRERADITGAVWGREQVRAIWDSWGCVSSIFVGKEK